MLLCVHPKAPCPQLPHAFLISPPRYVTWCFVVAYPQGLTVYCAVSVTGINYPCSLATFSPPGNGMVIIPPVSAPLRLVEDVGSSDGISLGCHLGTEPADASADCTTAANAGGGDGDGGAVSESAGADGWRRWLQRVTSQRTEAHDADSAGAAGSARTGRYAGSILIVSRGECTFEQKVSSDGGPVPSRA